MKSNASNKLLVASIAGLLAAAGTVVLGASTAGAVSEGMEACYGINACKGTGDCGGKGHSCAGKNGCEGQAWLEVPEDTCLKIKGGRLTLDE